MSLITSPLEGILGDARVMFSDGTDVNTTITSVLQDINGMPIAVVCHRGNYYPWQNIVRIIKVKR